MRRWIVLLALPLLVAAFGVAFGLPSTSIAAGPPSRELEFLAELQQRATAGETWAQDAVSELESLAAARDLSPQELALAGGVFTERTNQPIPVGAQGVRPFFVRLDAVVDLSTAANLEAYLADRKAALTTLARVNAIPPITASLGFSGRPAVGEVLDLARAHNAAVQQVILDASIQGGASSRTLSPWTRRLTYPN